MLKEVQGGRNWGMESCRPLVQIFAKVHFLQLTIIAKREESS